MITKRVIGMLVLIEQQHQHENEQHEQHKHLNGWMDGSQVQADISIEKKLTN